MVTEQRRGSAGGRIRVGVVGPGAIGTTVSALLHEAGNTPTLYGRTPRTELTLIDGDRRIVVPGPVRTDPAAQPEKADVLFLAVKATQTAAAAPWLRALCAPGTVVCVLQNGVEQIAAVRPHVPEGVEVVPAVVWFPAQSQEDGTILLRGEPRLTLPASPEAERIADVLRDTRCQVELAGDFTTLAWRKLLQNAAAGLMALTGRRAGVFTRPDFADLTLDYLKECLAVSHAEGAALSDDVPAAILARFQAFPADMSTSILTDREAGRPLEWDIRNGVISRLARRHDIHTPISDAITALLAATSDGPG
ncbi:MULTISPECIES: oxidoreductase [Propionibacteriaceae]|uniref:2-dehydropantoate 2-reductase n=1 Tax=Propionibacterium freudenreichii subsp. freudenreichii TaxID=66712 RepID=A0A0B7NYN8_PROFF|nr:MULTISPECIES: oxidoreductase [Propionibacteriaceae]CEP25733.1 2-dehydropantoate 2-reductase [Propionibacterium freudenreichii subsp. freudenreichii]MCT2973783.1 oxidoreductase [Propionibacterium freudenreichii]MCT2977045.1 oxidoreductase [Propionibacterium freudenreichii]MCT2978136.1 oxidoreductase [Propionibacterium freudenreichii]MCT2985487.1 oxidoreductase [Propionibacterium freudenreichii]